MYCTDRPFYNYKKAWNDFHWCKTLRSQIINFAIPCNTRVDDKEVVKIEKYLDLAGELKKVWNMKNIVIPLVVVALDTPAKELMKRLKTIHIETTITKLQKIILIHTSRILRKVIVVWVFLTPYLKKYNISVCRNIQ